MLRTTRGIRSEWHKCYVESDLYADPDALVAGAYSGSIMDVGLGGHLDNLDCFCGACIHFQGKYWGGFREFYI